MIEITCYDCDGRGLSVSYELTGLPEQELCQLCKGSGKIMVEKEFAKAIQGEDAQP